MATGHSDQARYDFTSRWQLETGRESVWEALVEFHDWPTWWPGLKSVEETAAGDENGIGQSATSSWRGPLGYTLNFAIETVERSRPEFLRGIASGDLEGSGRWVLSEIQAAGPDAPVWTQVRFDWQVEARQGWMRRLDRVARPIFVLSHDHVMKKGAEGLAGHLGCQMRDFTAGDAGQLSSD